MLSHRDADNGTVVGLARPGLGGQDPGRIRGTVGYARELENIRAGNVHGSENLGEPFIAGRGLKIVEGSDDDRPLLVRILDEGRRSVARNLHVDAADTRSEPAHEGTVLLVIQVCLAALDRRADGRQNRQRRGICDVAGHAHQVFLHVRGGYEVCPDEGGEEGIGPPLDDVRAARGHCLNLPDEGLRVPADGNNHLGVATEGRLLGGPPDGDESGRRVRVGRR